VLYIHMMVKQNYKCAKKKKTKNNMVRSYPIDRSKNRMIIYGIG